MSAYDLNYMEEVAREQADIVLANPEHDYPLEECMMIELARQTHLRLAEERDGITFVMGPEFVKVIHDFGHTILNVGRAAQIVDDRRSAKVAQNLLAEIQDGTQSGPTEKTDDI